MLFIACLHEDPSCDMPIGPFPCTRGSHFSTLINHLSSVPIPILLIPISIAASTAQFLFHSTIEIGVWMKMTTQRSTDVCTHTTCTLLLIH